MIFAAIDIGSNAVRLLITQVEHYKDGSIDYTKLLFLRIPLRLGMDVFHTGIINPEKIETLSDTMKAYSLLMKIHKVDYFEACATSAMREAKNQKDVMDFVQKNAGINIKVISGSEEADIINETNTLDQYTLEHPCLYIDVGGGSTELTLSVKNKTLFKESFNVGTIRLLNDDGSDKQLEYLKCSLKSKTKDLLSIRAVGTGGNINKVFSLSKQKEGRSITLEVLKKYYRELKPLTIEERMHQYKLRQDRADVIVPALQIYTSIMRWANIDEIFVPKVGLTDGIIKKLHREYGTAGTQ